MEVGEKGFGFLRNPAKSFQISPNDIYVSPDVIRKFRLKAGTGFSEEVDLGSNEELFWFWMRRSDIRPNIGGC